MTDVTMGEISRPQPTDIKPPLSEKDQRVTGMRKWVEGKVLTHPFEKKDLSDAFAPLSPREKTDLLYEKLMAYNVTDHIIREEAQANPDVSPEPPDPYLLNEINVLWNDPTVQTTFLDRFTDARVEAKLFKSSELGGKWKENTKAIAETKEAFESEIRSLHLGQVARPDQVAAAKGRASRFANKLIELGVQKEDVVHLEGKPHTKENTDVAAHIMYETLSAYHEQAKEGFVWLPSREDIHAKTIAALQNGRWPVLTGESGTGKSEQADAAAVVLTGEQPTHLPCGPSTGPEQLIADKDIENGQSYLKYGPAMQAATGYLDSRQTQPAHTTGRVVRLDESGKLGPKGYSEIKELRQKRSVTRGDLERYRRGENLEQSKILYGKPVLPGFAAILTTNPPGTRYQDRTEPDAALRRELAPIPVDYPPMTTDNPELYEFMLATLMDQTNHIPAAKAELAPAYEVKQPTQEERLPDGRRVLGHETLISDPTDTRHGTLYRLAFAVRSLQDAFNNGNAESLPENALRFTTDANGRISVVSQGGDPLTLNNSTITLGEVSSWMRGFLERRMKDDPKMQTESLSDYLKVKLETYLDQTDIEDREKIRAIFDHYKLFNPAPNLKNAQPVIPSEIGYLSPRVPKPLQVEESLPLKEAKNTETTAFIIHTMHDDMRLLLEDGSNVLVNTGELFFPKDGRQITLRPGMRFTIEGNKLWYAGTTADGKVVARIDTGRADEALHQVIEFSVLHDFAEFSKAVSEQEAREILGTDFLGVEEVEKALMTRIDRNKVPEIPWTEEELQKAKLLGEYLVLRMDKDAAGASFTMQNLQQKLQRDFDANGKGKIFYDTDWYKGEDFFKKDAPNVKWALVKKEVIPDSTSKNYLQQTERIADYLTHTVYTGVDLPDGYRMAIDEFTAKKARIQSLMTSDWQEAARQLADLSLNKLTRQKSVETVYDALVYFQNNGDRLLENMYTWNNSRSSHGYLVLTGRFDSGGLGVDGSGPDRSHSSVGVVLSR